MKNEDAPLVLYGNTVWASPYVLSVFVALRAKGLAFDVRGVALERGAHRASDYTAASLTSRVPMLVDGDFALSESSAIVEYLEDAYPAPRYARVLPEGVRDRARARQIMAWIRSDLMPIREERSAEYVFYSHERLVPFAPLSDAAKRASEKLYAAADRLIPQAGGPLFGSWCVADTDLAMMLQRLVKTGAPVPAKLRAYADREWQREAVLEYASHERPPFASST